MKKICTKYTNKNKRVSRYNPEYTRLKKSKAKQKRQNSLRQSQIKKLKITPSIIKDKNTGYKIKYNRFADN